MVNVNLTGSDGATQAVDASTKMKYPPKVCMLRIFPCNKQRVEIYLGFVCLFLKFNIIS